MEGLHFIRRDAAGHEQTVLDLSVSQHSHLALGQVRPKHDACLDEHLAPNDQSCQALQEESQHVCIAAWLIGHPSVTSYVRLG